MKKEPARYKHRLNVYSLNPVFLRSDFFFKRSRMMSKFHFTNDFPAIVCRSLSVNSPEMREKRIGKPPHGAESACLKLVAVVSALCDVTNLDETPQNEKLASGSFQLPIVGSHYFCSFR